jgi:hypothetical protein
MTFLKSLLRDRSKTKRNNNVEYRTFVWIIYASPQNSYVEALTPQFDFI